MHSNREAVLFIPVSEIDKSMLLKTLETFSLEDYKGAVETAKKSLAAAEKAKYQAYIDINNASIEEWSKKKK